MSDSINSTLEEFLKIVKKKMKRMEKAGSNESIIGKSQYYRLKLMGDSINTMLTPPSETDYDDIRFELDKNLCKSLFGTSLFTKPECELYSILVQMGKPLKASEITKIWKAPDRTRAYREAENLRKKGIVDGFGFPRMYAKAYDKARGYSTSATIRYFALHPNELRKYAEERSKKISENIDEAMRMISKYQSSTEKPKVQIREGHDSSLSKSR